MYRVSGWHSSKFVFNLLEVICFIFRSHSIFVFYLYHASIFDKVFTLRMDLIIHKICFKCFILAGTSEEIDDRNADENTDKNTAGLNEDVLGKWMAFKISHSFQYFHFTLLIKISKVIYKRYFVNLID